MSKKLAALALIMAIALSLGCTSQDQNSGTAQPTTTPQVDQPGTTPAMSITSPADTTTPPGDSGVSPTTSVNLTSVNATPDNNDSTPEMDLPLPPDLANL